MMRTIPILDIEIVSFDNMDPMKYHMMSSNPSSTTQFHIPVGETSPEFLSMIIPLLSPFW